MSRGVMGRVQELGVGLVLLAVACSTILHGEGVFVMLGAGMGALGCVFFVLAVSE